MNQKEAEKLARKLLATHSFEPVRRLCDYILSGDHKREIENAAFKQAATILDDEASCWENSGRVTAYEETRKLRQLATRIRSLIQSPTQRDVPEPRSDE